MDVLHREAIGVVDLLYNIIDYEKSIDNRSKQKHWL
ncbi:hypothetical protein HDE69_004864 [Pedobacter cryoconitis]|uniref:Uncharacterized protein n=1 Tax=Pedobacter cryoconitis TaxID=188932 RepID=A0A7W8YXT1_9SPHI|nr:hypothetical protein [Pedobacter cryoconitis]MBB5645186.1 hypothetical protein [Pedobacter cryoconitis]